MKDPRRWIIAAACCLALLAFTPPAAVPAPADTPRGCCAERCGCPAKCDCGEKCDCGTKRGCGKECRGADQKCPCPGGPAGMRHPAPGGVVENGMGMEAMKEHLDQVRRTVADLRRNEKKMETLADPAAFRAAAVEQFRMIDDVLESHLKRMESMMERRSGAAPGPRTPADSGTSGAGKPPGQP